VNDLIHLCDWSGHNSLHIKCDDSWTTAPWDEPRVELPVNVYLSDDRRLYTFQASLVTCPGCRSKPV
jgi:hypothetical protein